MLIKLDYIKLPTKLSKRGALTRPEFLEGLAGKEARDFFQGGCSFYVKNKLKSEIFNYKKKFINENIFLCPN